MILVPPGVAGNAEDVTTQARPSSPDLFGGFRPLGAASPVLRALDLDRHGLQWFQARHRRRTPEDRTVVLFRNVAKTAAPVNGSPRAAARPEGAGAAVRPAGGGTTPATRFAGIRLSAVLP
ncbi:hypothetical protein [Micromonospora tulbaghiae]|uniref:hypothetical protein n=1 Tax=Micromonospora tulbaghiae TaxID=479978 RepID=UPI0034291361